MARRRKKSRRSTAAKGKRVVTITRGKGKLRGRYCVKVKLGAGDKVPHARRAAKGAFLAPVQFHGCFTKSAKAQARASKLRNARKL